MLVLLSPAKTLDFEPTALPAHTMPRMLADSRQLVKALRQKTAGDLQAMMGVSEQIAVLNAARYRQFKTPFTSENAKQAILAFRGDVYEGLQAETFSEDEMAFAQRHLRILSGLYGLLTPLDLMQPYRLEMGTRLEVEGHASLYGFWGDKITRLLNKDLAASGSHWVVNLASQEYFKAVKPALVKGKVLHVHFQELRDGQYKVISFNAKRARGGMARQMVQYGITEPAQLRDLCVDGYTFDEGLSGDLDFYFIK